MFTKKLTHLGFVQPCGQYSGLTWGGQSYETSDGLVSSVARPSSNGTQPTLTPKSSMDYVLASSTSSYAHSIMSSSFTLSLNTTGNSSASSSLSDHKPNTNGLSNNAFAIQLKSSCHIFQHFKIKFSNCIFLLNS